MNRYVAQICRSDISSSDIQIQLTTLFRVAIVSHKNARVVLARNAAPQIGRCPVAQQVVTSHNDRPRAHSAQGIEPELLQAGAANQQ